MEMSVISGKDKLFILSLGTYKSIICEFWNIKHLIITVLNDS
jgi:hypothetical protein